MIDVLQKLQFKEFNFFFFSNIFTLMRKIKKKTLQSTFFILFKLKPSILKSFENGISIITSDFLTTTLACTCLKGHTVIKSIFFGENKYF